MKRRTCGFIAAALVLVLVGSIAYLIHRQRAEILSIGQSEFSQADSMLETAVSLPIPENPLSDRAITVAQAAAFLQSADLSLEKIGVRHLYGIAEALYGFSYDLPYPNVFGRKKVQREWQFTVLAEKELSSCWVMNNNPSLNLKRLRAVIAELYKKMPVSAVRRAGYYDASQ